MEVIKFRRPHFRIEDNSFHSFTYWGPVEGGFKSPEKISSCYSKEDQMFIGMLDKNQKEIYEGDFDKAGNVVEYLSGSFCLNGDRLIPSNFEIIGNTYEHPHLLTN